MTTGADREIQGWMEEWKAGEREIPAGLNERILRRVKRQSLNQKLFLALEILTGVVMAAFLVGVGLRSSHPADLPMVICFLGLILGAIVWGIRIRRGLWHPEGHSTADFLNLSLRRVRQRARMVRAGYVLLAIELAVFIPWILVRSDSPGPAFQQARVGVPAPELHLYRSTLPALHLPS